jgi:long-chain acyl-CoA synthetase
MENVMADTLLKYIDRFARLGAERAFAHRHGLRVARWSYAQVAETSFRFARELEERGVAKGDRVMFWAENSAEWVAAFFGCLLKGAVAVPLDAPSAPDFAARVCEQVGPKLLLTDAETAAQAAALPVPTLRLDTLTAALARHSDRPYAAAEVSDSDLVEIVFTSGTTAEPKGVCLAHRNLAANLAPLEREINKYLRWERLVHPLRFLNLLPLSHVFGQFMGVFVPPLLAGETFLLNSVNPSEIIETVRRERISVVVTVPRLLVTLREKVERDWAARGVKGKYERLLAESEGWHWAKRWWHFRRVHAQFGWKFWAFVSGGAALDAETEAFWRRLGFAVVQGYGMTETASIITVSHPFRLSKGSIGKALPGQEVKLGAGGEIMVRGANVAAGVWEKGVRPLADSEGWLRTGDVGERDAEGNLFFRGRSKEVIVAASGLNIYPEDLEAALDRQPEIRLSAVVGVEGPRGPEPVAVLIPRAAVADLGAAVARANESLARHQQIRRWFVWPHPDFPRTATRKVRKRDLLAAIKDRGKAQSGESGAALLADKDDDPLTVILDAVARVTGDEPRRRDGAANLVSDLKLDSLGLVELMSLLEDHFQIELDEGAFTSASTLGDVERLIKAETMPAAPAEWRERGAASTDSVPPPLRYPYPRWARRFPVTWLRRAAFYALLLPLTRLMCWVRAEGKEHLRGVDGPVIFVANHITYIDHALILSALPGRFGRNLAVAMDGERLRRWRFPAREAGWLRRVVGRVKYALVVALFNVFPLPQQSGFRRAFAYAGEALDGGASVLIFPEGRRTETGRMQPFRAGTGLLATEAGVPVVPVRIAGLFELKRGWEAKRLALPFARPGRVSVTFGEPERFAADVEPGEVARELERRVARLGSSGS